VKGTDQEFREEILKRFKLRPEMTAMVEKIKSSGLIVAILSDQTTGSTSWTREPLFITGSVTFSILIIQENEERPSIFKEICSLLGVRPKEVLFVDDNMKNVKRAASQD